MNYFSKTRSFIKKNEKYISPIAIFGGFIIDSLTLQRIDMLFENIILASYILLSGILVLLISLVDLKENPNKFLFKIRPFLGVALLFVFGGVFSGFTIFYTRSANIISAWPFLLILLGVMIGTEYMKKYFTRMTVQVVVFYFSLLSYLIFLIPIVLKKIGIPIFLISGFLSLILIYFYIKIIQKIIGSKFHNTKINIWRIIISVFALINILYFTNIIPPIPLSLKDADVFHSVKREGGTYTVLDEQRSFFDRLTIYEKVRIRTGETIYLYSSVFAPTKLNTEIIHEWQYRDTKGRWITSSKIPFKIYGGNDYGYRGYTLKSNLTEGRWRVNIKTPNGQLIGRKTFNIIVTEEKQTLVTKIR